MPNLAPIPNPNTPVLADDQFSTIWYRFFAALVSGPIADEAVAVGASPFAYEASHAGALFVSGGTVSAITVTRAGVVVPTGVTAGPIPLALGDTATITYTVAPTVNFLGS